MSEAKYDTFIAEIKHHLGDVLAEEALRALIKIINDHDLLKEKAKKWDESIKSCEQEGGGTIIPVQTYHKMLEENKVLKAELETISDKLGNELQVKYLEIEQLKDLYKASGLKADKYFKKLEKGNEWLDNQLERPLYPNERNDIIKLKAILKENN